MQPNESLLGTPLGRPLQVFLALFGLLLGALIVGTTVAVLALTGGGRPDAHRAPLLTASQPREIPAAPPATSNPDPVQQAQDAMDVLVAQFAQSADVPERRRLLAQIRALSATPGVTVPNH